MSSSSRLNIWSGLLNWSLSQTPSEPAPPSELRPLSDEDREFLTRAFEEHLLVDEIKRMKLCIEILNVPDSYDPLQQLLKEPTLDTQLRQQLSQVREGREEEAHLKYKAARHSDDDQRTQTEASTATATTNPTNDNTLEADIRTLQQEILQKKCGALDELDDRCLTIDNANDFQKLNGARVLIRILRERSEPALLWRCCQLLATICQNNETCIEKCRQDRTMSVLLERLSPPGIDTSDIEWLVVTKCIYALGALLRSANREIINEFLTQSGVIKLLRVMEEAYKARQYRTLIKSCALLRTLLIQDPVETLLQSSLQQLMQLLIQGIKLDDEVNLQSESILLLHALLQLPDTCRSICNSSLYSELSCVVEARLFEMNSMGADALECFPREIATLMSIQSKLHSSDCIQRPAC